MRTTALALATLIVLGLGRTTLAQASATAKITGQSQQSQPKQNASTGQQRAEMQAAYLADGQQPGVQQAMMFVPQQPGEGQQPMMLVQQQLPDGQQVVFLVPQQAAAGGVQLVGHHQPMGACPNCPGGQQYGPPWTGGYAYNYPSDYVHPGQPHSGGHYGAWGGAHRTPGYPHHHLHREYVGPQGPPTAQTAYPYYTVRGPRDFLMDNPPSIGR